MSGTAVKILLFIVALVIGVGVTLLFDNLIPGSDQLTLVGIAVAMTLASFISLYFMSKSRGS